MHIPTRYNIHIIHLYSVYIVIVANKREYTNMTNNPQKSSMAIIFTLFHSSAKQYTQLLINLQNT